MDPHGHFAAVGGQRLQNVGVRDRVVRKDGHFVRTLGKAEHRHVHHGADLLLDVEKLRVRSPPVFIRPRLVIVAEDGCLRAVIHGVRRIKVHAQHVFDDLVQPGHAGIVKTNVPHLAGKIPGLMQIPRPIVLGSRQIFPRDVLQPGIQDGELTVEHLDRAERIHEHDDVHQLRKAAMPVFEAVRTQIAERSHQDVAVVDRRFFLVAAFAADLRDAPDRIVVHVFAVPVRAIQADVFGKGLPQIVIDRGDLRLAVADQHGVVPAGDHRREVAQKIHRKAGKEIAVDQKACTAPDQPVRDVQIQLPRRLRVARIALHFRADQLCHGQMRSGGLFVARPRHLDLADIKIAETFFKLPI